MKAVNSKRTGRPVVVGGDGCDVSWAAVRAGVWEAQPGYRGPTPGVDHTVDATAAPRPGPVIVGVDGSSQTSAAALAFAFEESAVRAVRLVAVYAWWTLPPDNLGPVRPGHYNERQARAQAARMRAEAVSGWSQKYPDVTVGQRPVHAINPSLALIEASWHAGLVVLGCRGRGGFSGLLLGSVGRDLVGHAHAPVAVIHEHA